VKEARVSEVAEVHVGAGRATARTGRRLLRLAVGAVVPAAAFALLLLLWELIARWRDVPRYVLAKPSEFLPLVYDDRHLLWTNSLTTLKEILLGFALAVVVSIPLGYLLATSRFAERALYPVVVFFQIVPKIAVAPMLVIWFGFGLVPKVILTFVICFFPLVVDSMTGFKSLDVRLLYLSRSMGASRWQTLRYLRLPSAMPSIFSGLKVSVVFAVNAAIVGEFISANAGLGFLLLRGSGALDLPLVFAVLVAMSVLGLALSYAVEVAEGVLMPWRTQVR
jgi:NitT/TauT family transport system permease protein